MGRDPGYVYLDYLKLRIFLSHESHIFESVKERDCPARERPPNRPAAPLAACVTGLTLLAISTKHPAVHGCDALAVAGQAPSPDVSSGSVGSRRHA